MPNIQTSLISIMSNLIKDRSGELARNATEAICATTCGHVFEKMLKLYNSHEELMPTDSVAQSTINFLKGLQLIKCNAINDAIELIVSAVWQNPELSDAAAKAITSLLPLDIFPMANNTCILVIHPEGTDKELHHCERDIQSKVDSGTLTSTEAALQYLDPMMNPRLIYQSHQKILCLLNAAQYFIIECKRPAMNNHYNLH